MKNAIKGVKTTITGIVFIVLAILYTIISLEKGVELNIWIIGGLVGSAIAFVYFPDDFITKLKSVLKNFKINGKTTKC